MDVFKMDQVGSRESGRHHVGHHNIHHGVTTEVSFDTTSDFNLSFFDSSSTPPTPPTGGAQQQSNNNSTGVVIKEELLGSPESGEVSDQVGLNSSVPPSPQQHQSVEERQSIRPATNLFPPPSSKSSSTPPSTPTIIKNGKCCSTQ